MNSRRWIAHFRTNPRLAVDRGRPCAIPDPDVRRALAGSLAVFQLGETGGGTRLMRFARELPSNARDPGRFARYAEAVELFVAEENHHADLLRDLVHHLGGETLERQWSNSVFRGVRSLFTLEFNIQVLLTAELIAEAYYGLLYRHAGDPVVTEVCAKIVRDEVKHIAFHVDFFGTRFRRMPAFRRALWKLRFRGVLAAACAVVWHDHRSCFRALGVGRGVFREAVARACGGFLCRLDARLDRRRAVLPERGWGTRAR